MSFQDELASTNFKVVRDALIRQLNSVTDKAVLAFDREVEEAEKKDTVGHKHVHALFSQFETDKKNKASRPAELLEKWTHYAWIRSEVNAHARRAAMLNKLGERTKAFQESTKKSQDSRVVRALPKSIHRAIQKDFIRQVSIEKSLENLSVLTLHVVSTAHPTDPLANEARDDLTVLATMLSQKQSEDAFKRQFKKLWMDDPIPREKRTVQNEVNRNLNIMERLYNAIPHFIKALIDAYKMYYGEQLFSKHEEHFWKIIGGVIRDAAWPGFDADGNENVDDVAMQNAIRVGRIRAAEQHIRALSEGIVREAKRIETDLRSQITGACSALSTNIVRKLTKMEVRALGDVDSEKNKMELKAKYKSVRENLSAIFADITKSVSNRNFRKIENDFNALVKAIEDNDISSKSLLSLIEKQKTNSEVLHKLARFSGLVRYKSESRNGDIQELQIVLQSYKDSVRDSTTHITVKEDGEERKIEVHAVAAYVSKRFQHILDDNKEMLSKFPDLKLQMRYFGVQLNSIGLTYGRGHVRQNSPVHKKVWSRIVDDLMLDPKFQDMAIFKILKNNSYEQSSSKERTDFHVQLLNGSEASDFILGEIYRRFVQERNPNSYKMKKLHVVFRELGRYNLAVRNPDIVGNIIISNTEGPEDIFEVEAILAIFRRAYNRKTDHKHTKVIPLLEKWVDLDNYEKILVASIKFRIEKVLVDVYEDNASYFNELFSVNSCAQLIQCIKNISRSDFSKLLKKQSADKLRKLLSTIHLEAMVGYSDTERVSSPMALVKIQQLKEDLRQLAEDFGVHARRYDGPGDDPNRGGPRRRDRKATLQGRARYELLEPKSALERYRETQFYNAFRALSEPEKKSEFARLTTQVREWIKESAKKGAKVYEHLHDVENGLGKLFGVLLARPYWMVPIRNSSSRASTRGWNDNTGDRASAVQKNGTRPVKYVDPDKPRAISSTMIKQSLRDYTNLIFGPGYGLREMGLEKCVQMYKASSTVRDLVIKTTYGLALMDFSMLRHGLFNGQKNYIPKDSQQRGEWARNCMRTLPKALKNISVESLVKKLEVTEGLDNKLKLLNEKKEKMSKGENVSEQNVKSVQQQISQLEAQKINEAENLDEVLTYLSELVAYIEEEAIKTRAFIFELNKHIHEKKYKEKGAPKSVEDFKDPTDILYHFPRFQAQVKQTVCDLNAVSVLFARQVYQVANGACLDELYSGVNEQEREQTQLSGVARLLGNIGACLSASEKMPPAYYESLLLSYRQGLRTQSESQQQGEYGKQAGELR